ncbi:MAG: PfkB family carbohydrate kinase [Endomicrobia bacterium]|nr:PfkB family carbohydrate kinase [Endomicrobiia bacterium]MCL2800119.1 PfkB family carbohydrate kinase [Endomicrobiia bacterium]
MKILALACFCVDVFPESGKVLPGGNALNLAVNCKLAGHEVFVMGNIGKDKYGEILKSSICKYKLDCSKIYEIEGQTANHIIHIDKYGDRYFKDNAWTGGVWDKFKISEDDKSFIKNMDVLATTVFEPDFENIVKAGKAAKCLAVDFHDIKINSSHEKYFPLIDLFFISGKNQDSPEFRKYLKDQSEKYKTIFTATLGERGSIAYEKGKEYVCEALKAEKVTDTTGCGDSYQAGFITEYVSSKNIKKSMQKGSQFAAKTLSYVGGFEI